MKNLIPKQEFKDVTKIDIDTFFGQDLIIFDIDNTLFFPESTETRDDIIEWFKKVNESNHCICVSNSHTIRQRKEKIKEKLGCEIFISDMKKPSKELFDAIQKKYDVEPSRMTVIGDMRMTDILFGNRGGANTILVKPIGKEKLWSISFARLLENSWIYIYSIFYR